MKSRKTIVFIIATLVLAGGLLCYVNYRNRINGNQPYEPSYPAPDPHQGTFVSDHGTMEFNGDGKTVKLDFDSYLSGLTGLPEGPQQGTYVFLSGDLPPNGSVEVRYDTAHELKLTVGENNTVIELGIVNNDGKTTTSGVGTVTEDRIPLVFTGNGEFISVVFTKK